MNIISTLVLALAIAAPAAASDFAGLQNMDAAGISKINPFPNPSNPDSCYLAGFNDGLCRFKCRSGETFQVKPVNPQADSLYQKCGAGDYRDANTAKVNPFPNPSNPDSCYLAGYNDGLCRFKCRNGETFQAKPVNPEADSLYKKCGGGDYRGGDKQLPDAGSIWAQINQQHNPFPQPQTTLDYCVFTEFKNNKCLFKCESGAVLTEPAQKPDFSTGEPAGACATHIIRPVKPAFAFKAAAGERVYDSYGRYPTEQKAAEVMVWAANGLKFARAEVTEKTVTAAGPGQFGFRLAFRSASPLAIESSPLFKVELDAYERMFDMADRLEDGGASVATHEVVAYGGEGFYYVIGYFAR